MATRNEPEDTGPFVHRFQTDRGKYVYDVNSNRVLRVSDVAYEILENVSKATSPTELARQYPQYAPKQIKQCCREIVAAREKDGLFLCDRPSRMSFSGVTSAQSLLQVNPLQQLILNITERCNLRCRYCTYGGIYAHRRGHSNKDMSLDTAQAAVHRFLENLGEEPCLSFYGGEPLLRFDLIEEVIAYTEAHTKRQLGYTITTNGTLLTTPVCDYLRAKRFNILVSLDGPHEIHDRYRVDGIGRGTFQEILSNLQPLRATDEDYYRTHVSFSVVSAPPHRLGVVDEFFRTHPSTRGCRVAFSFMAPGANAMFDASADALEHDGVQSDDLHDKYFDQAKVDPPTVGLGRAMFERDLVRFYDRPRTQLGTDLPLHACCVPGSRRLFVTAEGVLYACERVDERYPIGTVETWIDPCRLQELLDDYCSAGRECLTCWACRLCTECFSTRKMCDAPMTDRKGACDQMRARLHELLVDYHSVLEDNENAWEYLSKVKDA